MPLSIWQPDWQKVKQLKDWVGDAGQTRHLEGRKMALLGSKYTTSIFNPHFAQMILSAYCPPKAKVYDAFGGGGTRGFIATAMGHEYMGIEIRPDEVERIKKRQNELGLNFEMVCADSQFYPIEESYYDFSYSCPPYYDLEVYSTIDGDMSNVSTYGEFLIMLRRSLETTFKGLKSSALCCWVVGNFRNNKGEYIHFNGDVMRIAKEIGFILHDELILWSAAGIAAQRAGLFVANRKSVRVHEYLEVWRKP